MISFPQLPLSSSAIFALSLSTFGHVATADVDFHTDIEPILSEFCYDCHGDGENKGKVAFDEFKSDAELLEKRDLWHSVLNNVRTGIMPPEKKPRPSAEQREMLGAWIKRSVFGIDPANPDPGRVTIRRLNRVEYRNTIRDLLGFDFKVEDELPPDDTGYGFDNIGDVLTLSPMLLEKYMQAAEAIVAAAVPRVARVVGEKTLRGNAFRDAEGKHKGDRFSFYNAATVAQTFKADHAGTYRFVLDLGVDGQFDFDPGRCRVTLKIDDVEAWQQEFEWANEKKFEHAFERQWDVGEHRLTFEIHPLTPPEQKKNSLDVRIASVRIKGPLEAEHWVRPKGFELFFTHDVPGDPAERHQYAREVLQRFAMRAFRRPVDDPSLDRLVAIAEAPGAGPGDSFEDGIAQAMVPILASPRFLFRVEDIDGNSHEGGHPFVDEFALASRLSYFLWSTMPDDELFRLAGNGELRKNLPAQVKRMLADGRSSALIENFVGQWLQVRDIDGIDINGRAVLARDLGDERDMKERRRRMEELRAKAHLTPEEEKEREELIEKGRRRFEKREIVELDGELRRALRQETEMAFDHVVRDDRSVLELIESDYTFLNERLAKHYGLKDDASIEKITGNQMRRVDLPRGHVRGGVLTHGSVLIVTSNPTRTSPVKRGLFVLDNFLGMPPPPPPPDIPNLEEAEGEFQGKDPTLRESLEVHRSQPLCNSCHNRMDPLGLALENFNALGMWRDKERGQPIDATGKLITGETFNDIRDVKRVLATNHRQDFYHCLTEKLLTYALGRGLAYYDAHTVDEITARLDKESGRFSALLMGVIESAPFQKRRGADTMAEEKAAAQSEAVAATNP